MKKQIIAKLTFGPMVYEFQIERPVPYYNVTVPAKRFTIWPEKRMIMPHNYITLIFERQETGIETDDRVVIDYELYQIKEAQ